MKFTVQVDIPEDTSTEGFYKTTRFITFADVFLFPPPQFLHKVCEEIVLVVEKGKHLQSVCTYLTDEREREVT